MDEMNNNEVVQETAEPTVENTVETPVNSTVNPMAAAPQGAGDKKGMAIASLVLGLVSVVFCCAWYLAIPAAIVGLVLGIKANKVVKTGLGTAGIVLSIIGLIVAVIWVIVVVIIGVSAGVMGALG